MDESGAIAVYKSPTTPHDLIGGHQRRGVPGDQVDGHGDVVR